MVLKLEGAAQMGFYDLQDTYRHQNTGWGPFKTAPIRGITFSSRSCTSADVVQAISAEFNLGHYVLLALPVAGGFHVFLAFPDNLNQICLITKAPIAGMPTEPLSGTVIDFLGRVIPFVQNFDILTYST